MLELYETKESEVFAGKTDSEGLDLLGMLRCSNTAMFLPLTAQQQGL